jgi:carbonic anhydrase
VARYLSTLIVAGVLGTALAASASSEEAHKHWSYAGSGGPEHWGSLDPAWKTCGSGRNQSPIDIRSADTKLQALPPLKLDYHPTTLNIEDNGHTILVNVSPGSSLIVGNDRYALVQFHFHHPSEERTDGKGHEMDVHFVHRNAAGQLAVVAVEIAAGRQNSLIELLWHNRPAVGHRKTAKNIVVDPAALVPANLSYFTYPGSLTTPPCSEGLRWFVLKTPVSASSQEVSSFAKEYQGNARPVQPLNGRHILSSK